MTSYDANINDNRKCIYSDINLIMLYLLSNVGGKTVKKKFYTEEKLYKIYALYDDIAERRAYIGKTVSKLSNVHSQHRRGHNRYTQELFETDLLEPEMVMLEEVTCTGAVAYKHVLAWIRWFEDNTFEMLNPDGMLNQSENMQEETQKIYEQISQLDFEEHLARCYQETRVVLRKGQEKREKEHASTQLCLRLTPTDKEAFRQYCERTKLRQTDAFAKLLHTSGENAEPDIQRLLELLEESEIRCTKLTQENTQLRSGLTIPRSERIENSARVHFAFAQQAIREFVKTTYTKDRYTDLPIKEFRYDDFKNRFPNAAQYQYPTEEGVYIVRLQALVWGKARNPVYFLMCKTQEGEYLKFRFYQKKEFIGVPVRQSFYALLDSLWQFAGRMAPDGAVDLVAAFPLLNAGNTNKREKLTLDEQILGAASKRGA